MEDTLGDLSSYRSAATVNSNHHSAAGFNFATHAQRPRHFDHTSTLSHFLLDLFLFLFLFTQPCHMFRRTLVFFTGFVLNFTKLGGMGPDFDILGGRGGENFSL